MFCIDCHINFSARTGSVSIIRSSTSAGTPGGEFLGSDKGTASRPPKSGVSTGSSLFPNPIAVDMYSGLKPRISRNFVRCLKKRGNLHPFDAAVKTKYPVTRTKAIANTARMITSFNIYDMSFLRDFTKNRSIWVCIDLSLGGHHCAGVIVF